MMRPALTLILCCLLSSLTFAEEIQLATVLQRSALLDAPYSDAKEITQLKAKQQVTVLQRRGGWYQVSSNGASGWLRMSRIRLGDGTTSKPDGEGLSQTLRFLSTGRSGADGVTVATGIRGLDSADVSNAKPDHKAVEALSQFHVAPDEAKAFAAQAQLQTQPLGYFKQK